VTQPNLDLLLDLAYHRDQVVHDPIALARYADVQRRYLLGAALHLSCIGITDGQEKITLPSSISDQIMLLQSLRLTELVDLHKAGLITTPYRAQSNAIEPINITDQGIQALADYEARTCPDPDGPGAPQ